MREYAPDVYAAAPGARPRLSCDHGLDKPDEETVMAGQGQPARHCACGTRLARDNRTDRCTACQKAASQRVVTPPEVPSDFWHNPELVDAIQQWHIGQVIRAYRLHPYHRQPIPQAVVANWLNLTQAQLSRIENGEPVTDLAKLIPIVNTLAIPTDLLWFKVPGSQSERLPVSDSDEEADVHRRQLLQGLVAGSVLSTAALTTLEASRRSLDRLLEGSEVSPDTLERWDAIPSEYGQRYQMVAPGTLLEDVASDFVELQYLLSLKQTTKSRMVLCRVSSQLATLAGIFLAAQGNKASAQNWFHTAGLAAGEATDTQLAGLALVRSSIVSLYHGAPERALAKLKRAQALLGGSPTPWRARALVVEARCLARVNQHEDARARLIEAETTFQDMPSAALRDPALGYTERQFHFTIGNAYTHLGMADEAEESQVQALGMYQPGEYLDPALIQLDQAQLISTSGDVDEACRKAVATIETVPPEHRGLVTHYGRSFMAGLPMGSHAALPVIELRELVAAPAASA